MTDATAPNPFEYLREDVLDMLEPDEDDLLAWAVPWEICAALAPEGTPWLADAYRLRAWRELRACRAMRRAGRRAQRSQGRTRAPRRAQRASRFARIENDSGEEPPAPPSRRATIGGAA